jgi:hypothetical protein
MAALGPATLDFFDRINAKTWMTGRKPVLGRAFGTGPGAMTTRMPLASRKLLFRSGRLALAVEVAAVRFS